MTITALVNTPTISDPTNFETYADNLLSVQLPTLITEINTATSAMNLNSTQDTSTSSVAIGTGSKTFTVTAGKSFLGGMFLTIADAAAPSTNVMYCQVTSYSSTSLVVNVISVQGSGTKTSWLISQSGYQFNLGGAMTFNGSITAPGLLTTNTFGFATGSGGTVTQSTSKGTAVTLNKPTGLITTHNASISGNSAASFTFNNTYITSANDYVIVNTTGDTATSTGSAYQVLSYNHAAGSCTIYIRNLTAGALAEVLSLRFFVINSVNA